MRYSNSIRNFGNMGKNEGYKIFIYLFILICILGMLGGKFLWISSLFCCSAARDSRRDLHILLRCWVGHVTCFLPTSMMTWPKCKPRCKTVSKVSSDDIDICYDGQGWHSRSWEVVDAAKLWKNSALTRCTFHLPFNISLYFLYIYICSSHMKL